MKKGEIYNTNNWGKIKILGLDHQDGYYHEHYKIRFIKTGNTYIKRKHAIKSGSVRDNKAFKAKHNRVGKIYNTVRDGKIKVLELSHKDKYGDKFYKIEFLETGNQYIKNRKAIEEGHVKDKKKRTIVNKTFDSNNWGKFKVLCFDYKKEDRHRYYKIKFLKTGNVYTKSWGAIIKGQVKDNKEANQDIIGNIYSSNNFGKFKVIDYIGYQYKQKYYKVRFLKTNYITIASRNKIFKGKIKDKFKPNVCGVGYLGDIKKVQNDRIYNIWHKILERCYNSNHTCYSSYGGKGVTISDRWKCYNNFRKDIKTIEGWDQRKFQNGEIELDKDKKQYHLPYSERVYSKETCCWLAPQENQKYIGVGCDNYGE